jgi:hypothetical protein
VREPWQGHFVVREAPVVALLVLVAVCLAGLGLVLRDPFALVAVAPLGAVLAAYLRRARTW